MDPTSPLERIVASVEVTAGRGTTAFVLALHGTSCCRPHNPVGSSTVTVVGTTGGNGLYKDPCTPQDWEDVGLERQSDAVELHRAGRYVACLYYLGFTAECFAKALCAAQGRDVPRGRNGHDVILILENAGFSPQVLPAEVRSFLTDRDVGLRYQLELPDDVTIEDEIRAATRFANWCTRQLRRRVRPQSKNRTGGRRRDPVR